MKEIFLSHSPQQTQKIAEDFSQKLQGGSIVGLQGDLGAGKTCFAKGVLSKLTGVPVQEITSPTFTLVEEYRCQQPVGTLYHVDLYRIERPEEAEDLPWDEFLGKNAITLIEWPEKFNNLLSHCEIEVHLLKKGVGEREIQILFKETP